jgi:isopropylmalate/homocitrate/citramalate synthase
MKRWTCDGEQTSGCHFSPEKLTIAQLLLDRLNVDQIEEIASAQVSEGGGFKA